MSNIPGRAATLYAVRDLPQVTALLSFAGPAPAVDRHDVDGQQALVAEAFAGMGWQVPGLLTLMRRADDFYFDTVSQIRMPEWTRGRVALVGDAGYAPSFLTGQGTSLAVVGAYVLAAALGAEFDVAGALPAYERTMRGFAERNQGIAESGADLVVPTTTAALWKRNALLRLAPLAARLGLGDRMTADVATSLRLDEVPAPIGSGATASR